MTPFSTCKSLRSPVRMRSTPKVLEFVPSEEYKIRGIFLKDIDVTMYYAGSFDKDEIVNFLSSHKGFRIQGSYCSADRTILDNSDQVGENCLTYMETVDGVITRCKIYNKMVQMLESKSVRETVGQHWKDLVCQKGHSPRVCQRFGQRSRSDACRSDVTTTRTTYHTTCLWRKR